MTNLHLQEVFQIAQSGNVLIYNNLSGELYLKMELSGFTSRTCQQYKQVIKKSSNFYTVFQKAKFVQNLIDKNIENFKENTLTNVIGGINNKILQIKIVNIENQQILVLTKNYTLIYIDEEGNKSNQVLFDFEPTCFEYDQINNNIIVGFANGSISILDVRKQSFSEIDAQGLNSDILKSPSRNSSLNTFGNYHIDKNKIKNNYIKISEAPIYQIFVNCFLEKLVVLSEGLYILNQDHTVFQFLQNLKNTKAIKFVAVHKEKKILKDTEIFQFGKYQKFIANLENSQNLIYQEKKKKIRKFQKRSQNDLQNLILYNDKKTSKNGEEKLDQKQIQDLQNTEQENQKLKEINKKLFTIIKHQFKEPNQIFHLNF